MIFGWGRKIGKLHLTIDGVPACGADAKLVFFGEKPPPRPLCKECEQYADRFNEPSLKVLMGEGVE